MRPTSKDRIRELLQHLEALDAGDATIDSAVWTSARDAIFEELSRLVRADGLAVYRRGDTLEAVIMNG